MRTALYVENSVTQVVLTPESDDEKAILAMIESGANARQLRVFRGSFYECLGGWVRAELGMSHLIAYGSGREDDRSLMLVVRPLPKVSEQPQPGVQP